MDTGKLVSLLEMLNKQLDVGAANQKKAVQNNVSTAQARARVKELMHLNKKSRTKSTEIEATRGYPSVSTKR